ncbi:hypothetical protein SO802_021595 [Lithocarpus litseifolius]|uniref:Uncharacterized protein n=1 Tax=Lithocarpus litseifolius TaxID=425828 RepID=A0AAW2CF92_9ROSI
MGNISCVFCGCKEQASVGVVERWGWFERLAEPGLHFFNPLVGQCFACYLSTRISSLDVKIETKTKVNAGLECVIGMEDYNDWEVGDVLEAFSSIEKKRTLEEASASMTAAFEGVGIEE